MKPTPGTIVGGLLMAALGAAAWWGGTELTEPAALPSDCAKIRVSRAEPGDGARWAAGEEVEWELMSTAVECAPPATTYRDCATCPTLLIEVLEVGDE